MLCPQCQNQRTRVLDSRETNEGKSIRRRRMCEGCKYRFTTFERVEYNLIVVKKNEAREPYLREKVEKGIWRACEKRLVTQAQVDEIIRYCKSG